MRIRTRYTLFKVIIGVGAATFLASLFDMFLNDSALFIPIMVAYGVLAVLALLLYIGYKPDLGEEAPASAMVAGPSSVAPQEVLPEEPVRAAEDPEWTSRVPVGDAHHFRCPFCAGVFALELTHLRKRHELRMDCPFCANTIRIPRNPKLTPGRPFPVKKVAADEQVLFICDSCGEFLRYSAPGQRPGERVRVHTCPHCGSNQVDPAVGAAA